MATTDRVFDDGATTPVIDTGIRSWPMTPTFDNLAVLIPPPTDGVAVPVDWASTADRLGFTPPEDYRQIVSTYGPGLFCGEISVWIPDDTEHEDLFSCIPHAHDALTEWREHFVRDATQWVDPGGVRQPVILGDSPTPFTAWGGGGSGAYFYWYRIGDDPNEWPVVSADMRNDDYLFHRDGIAAFIIAYVTGQYEAVAEIVAEADLSFDRWDAVGHGG